MLAHQLDTGLGCVPTSSMGRLFDAVSSLAGVRHVVDYEAEAAIELEALARAVRRRGGAVRVRARRGAGRRRSSPTRRRSSAPWSTTYARAPTRPRVAARFHAAVAALVVDAGRAARASATGLDVVALGGGVFANALLLGASVRLLEERGFTVLRPRLLPPNDGGIALGQILVGSDELTVEEERRPPCAWQFRAG